MLPQTLLVPIITGNLSPLFRDFLPVRKEILGTDRITPKFLILTICADPKPLLIAAPEKRIESNLVRKSLAEIPLQSVGNPRPIGIKRLLPVPNIQRLKSFDLQDALLRDDDGVTPPL